MNDIKLVDFIKIYDDALPHTICDMIVNAFDADDEYHEESFIGADYSDRKKHQLQKDHPNYDNHYRHAIEMNCVKRAETSPKWKNIVSFLNDNAVQQYRKYKQEMTDNGFPPYMLPDKIILEDWRMHRYDVGKHFYKDHVDSIDTKSAQRYLAFSYYPVTVKEGGETAFAWHLKDVATKPKKGRLMIFPTWFGYPHEAKVPISNNKYLIKTYLHYPGGPNA